MNETRNLVFSSALDNLCSLNSSFDKGVLRVAYHGKNRNDSFISKDTFEECIDSIFNCPIVCNYQRESDSIGGHDVDVVKVNDFVRLVNITQPVGVVPESAKWWWQEVTEENGDSHEYLCVEVLLWRRQEAYAHLKQNGITDQSMELTILKGALTDEGIYHISKFEFTAFCLLERDKPCFESAGLETFSRNYFTEQYSAMMDDFKREFAKVNAAPAEDVDTQNHSKGGEEQMNLTDLMAKYGLVESDIDFDMAEMTEEEIERKFAEIKAAKYSDAEQDSEPEASEPEAEETESESDETHDEENGNDEESESQSEKSGEVFSLTNRQLEGELCAQLRARKIQHHTYGEMPQYWMIDFDVERREVYAEDTTDYRVYGLMFEMNGDTPVIDFESRRRKKMEYVDWAEGSAEFSLQRVVEEVTERFSEKIEELERENEELKKFKNERLDGDRRKQNSDVFSQFADLVGNDKFEALKEKLESDCYCLSVEDLEDKCFAIRGRANTAQFSSNGNSVKLPVEGVNDVPSDEPYGGAFIRFGFNKK